jgi:hypothetical protein
MAQNLQLMSLVGRGRAEHRLVCNEVTAVRLNDFLIKFGRPPTIRLLKGVGHLHHLLDGLSAGHMFVVNVLVFRGQPKDVHR